MTIINKPPKVNTMHDRLKREVDEQIETQALDTLEKKAKEIKLLKNHIDDLIGRRVAAEQSLISFGELRLPFSMTFDKLKVIKSKGSDSNLLMHSRNLIIEGMRQCKKLINAA